MTIFAPVSLAARQLVLAATIAAAPAVTPVVAQAPPAAVPQADTRAQDIAALNTALNRLTSIRATFVQNDSQGTASGRFYLQRADGLRFEYDPPRTLLIVANKDTVIVQEHPDMSPYRARIEETPLRLLLQSNIDLARDATITKVVRDAGQLAVTAVESEGYAQGEITFVFSYPALSLERWVVTDPMGAQTSVTLSSVEENVPLDRALFRLPRTGVGPRDDL